MGAATVAAFGCGGAFVAGRGYSPPSADELLTVVRERQAAVRAMNAVVRARSKQSDPLERVQLVVERGGRLRFEAPASVQGDLAVVAVDGGRFTFIDHDKHVFRHGSACPANVATLLRIPLGPDQVAATLLGDAALGPAAPSARVEWDRDRSADVLVLEGPGNTVLWIGLHRPQLDVAAWDVVFVEGATAMYPLRWRVAYDDFERRSGIAVPRSIRFAEPGRTWEDGVEIEIRDRTLNPFLPADAFTLTAPAGYKNEVASCGR